MMFKFQITYLLLLSLSSIQVFAAPGRLTVINKQNQLKNGESKAAALSSDFRNYLYSQTLDHFNYNPQSYSTFNQRFVMNTKYWGGANSSAPIFAYLGEETSLDQEVQSIGFLTDNAPAFKALIVYIEHRFYGQSIPFGTSMEEAIQNENTRGYFNSAQALADYAEVLTFIKKNLNASNSPIIVIGGSYGGMLATWFRLKYPHIAHGALASSAPVLYFDNITPPNGYYSVISNDFKEASESCYNTIKQSWAEIDRVAEATPDGLTVLSRKFGFCRQLSSSRELKDYLDSVYTESAQYNSPPRYPVSQICRGIDGAPNGTDILGRISAGLVARNGASSSCYGLRNINPGARKSSGHGPSSSQTSEGWSWQRCTEMVIPLGRDGDDTMFEASPFDLNSFSSTCQNTYGVSPRPRWVTTYYGGHDIKLVLQRFGSNIIFSNGLQDPYSSGGVLENISDSLVAISTKNGSHCLDIVRSTQDDPDWLVSQRKQEVKVIQGWLDKYYVDLHKLKGN